MKFYQPTTDLMNALKTRGLITADIAFDDRIEWTYFYLWHHEGRRARMGASMMGPDFTQWEGMYEVVHRFYMEFVSDVREIVAGAEENGKGAEAEEVERLLDEILDRDEHRWFTGGTPAAERARRKAAAVVFANRYAGTE